jgi:hypothetical protein
MNNLVSSKIHFRMEKTKFEDQFSILLELVRALIAGNDRVHKDQWLVMLSNEANSHPAEFGDRPLRQFARCGHTHDEVVTKASSCSS